ncbi:MAG: DUF58 domain-containing protein [Chloroflexota bacterium]
MRGPRWWALLGGLFVLAALSGRGVLSVFVAVLAAATAASELWWRYGLSNVTFDRHLGAQQLSFGEETTLQMVVVNAKPLPLAWLLVRDGFPSGVALASDDEAPGMTLQQNTLSTLLSLRWYERVVRTHRLRGTQRGVFRFGPATVSSGDILGMRRRERDEPRTDMLIVYPRVVPVAALGLPADRPVGDWLGQRRIAPDPLRLATVREYSAGDSPRHIHWKASAHADALMTKVFDPGAALALVVAVDVQTLPRTFESVPEHLEFAISAAASLAVWGLDGRHAVGLCANGISSDGQRWVYVQPSRHPQQTSTLLAELAALTGLRGAPMHEVLRWIMPRLPLGATVLTVTALPTEQVQTALLALQEAGHPVLLLTVGDEAPAVPATIATHHLGGRDAWQRLATLELG